MAAATPGTTARNYAALKGLVIDGRLEYQEPLF
jgi:hypothetical protein